VKKKIGKRKRFRDAENVYMWKNFSHLSKRIESGLKKLEKKSGLKKIKK